MNNTITSKTLPEMLEGSINQTFEFFKDELTEWWIGNIIVSFLDKPTTVFQINTTRHKRKTWSHLDGCLNFAIEKSQNSIITFKLKKDDTYITFIHTPIHKKDVID